MNIRNQIRSLGRAKSAGLLCLVAMLALIFNASLSAQVMTVPSDLYCWWTADGTYMDGWRTNTAIPVNGAGFGDGLLGQAFEFHGNGDYLSFYLVIWPEPGSVEAWIYPTAAPDGEMLIAGAGGGTASRRPFLLLATNVQNQLVLRGVVDSVSDNVTTTLTLESTRTIPLNRWTHVAMTLSPESGMKLYLDGQLESASGPGKYWVDFAVRHPWMIGGDGNTGSFRGRIDEMKTFFRELSQVEIQQIYDQEKPGVPMLPVVLGCGPPENAWPALRPGDSFRFEVDAVSPGGLPLSYQWFFNGVSLPVETQYAIIFTNVQPELFGSYYAIVSNALGAVTSPSVSLPDPVFVPSVISPPTNTSAILGGSATFSVTVSNLSEAPLSYQWQFYATNLAGKINPTLTLSDLGLEQFGPYRVAISSFFGAVTSSPALLTLLPTPINSSSVVPVGTNDTVGSLAVPTGLRGVAAISAGPPSLALITNGTVVAWGSGFSSALQVPSSLNARAISSMNERALAIQTDGTLVSWGSPSPPTPGLVNISAVALGPQTGIALKEDRTVLSWPAYLGPPPPDCTNIVAVAAGSDHWLALKADGTVLAWGNNSAGQLQVPANLANVIAVSAFGFNSFALKSDGTLVPWGFNANVPAGLTNVVAIAGGDHIRLALTGNGRVFQWGDAYSGLPATGWLNVSNAVAVSAGALNGLVLLGDGTPRLTVEPWDQTVPSWSTAMLAGKAVGQPPLSYQWFFKDTPLAGQTRDTLSITNVELPNAGVYTLVVSNELGTVSKDLNLSVQLPPQPQLLPQTVVLHRNGTFEFGIGTVAGTRLEIQVSTNLANWVTLTTLRSLSDTVYYTDSSAITGPRFYRAHVVR